MPPSGSTPRPSPKAIASRSAAITRSACSSSSNRRFHPVDSAGRISSHMEGETVGTSSDIDVHEELSGAAIGRLHWMLGILITLITLFDGYDTFNPAYVIHYVAKPWGLSPSAAGLL